MKEERGKANQMFFHTPPPNYWITPERESNQKAKLPFPPSYAEHIGHQRSYMDSTEQKRSIYVKERTE
jgi:hypothetical protein